MTDAKRPRPWIPPNPNFKGLRLLLVGESHYVDPYSEDLTCEIVEDYGVSNNGSGRTPLFRQTHKAFTCDDPQPLSKIEFWNSVFFCNYFTRIFDDSNQKPRASDYEQSERDFDAALETLRPDAFVVMSSRLWHSMPNKCSRDFTWDGEGTVWRFARSGRDIPATNIHHPSSPRFVPQNWYRKLQRFVEFAQP